MHPRVCDDALISREAMHRGFPTINRMENLIEFPLDDLKGAHRCGDYPFSAALFENLENLVVIGAVQIEAQRSTVNFQKSCNIRECP